MSWIGWPTNSAFFPLTEAPSGLFITRERIEERAPLYTTDLFRGLAGIKVVNTGEIGNQYAVVLAGSRSVSLSIPTGRCFPAVWIDGQMVHQGTAGTTPGQAGPAYLDNLIHPEEIAGIEVYNSPASVPVQYNLHAACGVIVFWTRHAR